MSAAVLAATPPLAPAYAELHCLSNFSFLRGASHPHELVQQALALGYRALALSDECSVAGVVRAHMRQRPATASGVTFLTLEDESGQVNVIVWERIGREQRRPLLQARLLEVHGELQQQEGVMHLIAHRLIDRSALLGSLLTRSRDFH